jgi:hypothetical protein
MTRWTTAADRRLAGALVTAIALAIAAPGHAAPSADERLLAEALFREAKALMKEERWQEACPKLEESHRLEPLAGVLLNLALCHERQGRTATAWSEFRQALALAKIDGRADREKLAQEHIDALEPQLAVLTVVVPAALLDIEGLTIERNGAELARAGWGMSLPVDPGEHHLVVRAPGYGEHRVSATVDARSEVVLELPTLEREPTGPPDPPPTFVLPPEPPLPEPSDEPAEIPEPIASSTHPMTLAGWIIGGVGLGSVIVGAAFGVDAVSQESAAKERCSPTSCPDEDSLASSERAQRSATISSITFFGGLALVAGGVTLLLLAPDEADDPSVALSVGADRASLRLELPWP